MNKNEISIKNIFEKAYEYYQKGNLKEAEILFIKILKHIPKHFSSL